MHSVEKRPLQSKKWLAWLLFTLLAYSVTGLGLVLGATTIDVTTIVVVTGGVTATLIGGQSAVDARMRTARPAATTPGERGDG